MHAGQPGSLPPEIFDFLRLCIFLSRALSGSLSAVWNRLLDYDTTCFYCVAFRLHSPPQFADVVLRPVPVRLERARPFSSGSQNPVHSPARRRPSFAVGQLLEQVASSPAEA